MTALKLPSLPFALEPAGSPPPGCPFRVTRRTRPSSAIRCAARERDHGRCRFPGCESRRTEEEKQADGEQDDDPATPHRVQVFEPEDWPERIRRYEDEYPAGPRRPLVVPIPLLGCAHA